MNRAGIEAPGHPGIEGSTLDASVPWCLGAFPVDDWQFWAATAIFVFAAAWLLRGVLPVPWLSRRHAQKKSRRAVRLTIEGEALSQRRGGAEAVKKSQEDQATDERG